MIVGWTLFEEERMSRPPLANIEEVLATAANATADPTEEQRDAFSDIYEVTGSSCGDAGGHFLGIRNSNSGRAIQAYVEVSSNINGPWQRSQRIGPGQIWWVTCSATRTAQGVQNFYLRKTGAHYV